MSGLLLLVTRRGLLTSPKGRNASRDGLVKIGWMVYSLFFFCTFILSSTDYYWPFSLVCCVTNKVQGLRLQLFIIHVYTRMCCKIFVVINVSVASYDVLSCKIFTQ